MPQLYQVGLYLVEQFFPIPADSVSKPSGAANIIPHAIVGVVIVRVEIDKHGSIVNLMVIPENQVDQDLLESIDERLVMARKETEPTEDYPLYLVINLK